MDDVEDEKPEDEAMLIQSELSEDKFCSSDALLIFCKVLLLEDVDDRTFQITFCSYDKK